MNPAEFISVGARVVGIGPAGARSAVSRAYYGAFHEALAFLQKIGCAPSANGSAHSSVPQFLCCTTNDNARDAGYLLSDLHSDRVRADYRLDKPAADAMSFGRNGIEAAYKICELLAALDTVCKDPAVVDKIRAEISALKVKIQGL